MYNNYRNIIGMTNMNTYMTANMTIFYSNIDLSIIFDQDLGYTHTQI